MTADPEKTKSDEDPLGLKIFRHMRELSNAINEILPTKKIKPSEPPISEEEARNVLKSTDQMETIIPLETWKAMEHKERNMLLDKFYSIRDKYRYEREGQEMCAFEELQLYKCHKEDGRYSQFFDTSVSWEERIDKCINKRREYRRCVRVMTMALKTHAVFGNDIRYLKVVDEESKTKF